MNHKWSRNSHWSHHGNTLGIMNFMGGERERIGSVRRAADSYSVVSLLSCCFWNWLPDHKPTPVHRVQTTADAVVHPLPCFYRRSPAKDTFNTLRAYGSLRLCLFYGCGCRKDDSPFQQCAERQHGSVIV